MLRRIFYIASLALLLSSLQASAWNLQEALKGVGGKDNTSAIGSALGNLLSTDKITVKSLVGTWNYTAPAVSFKSENVLKKAGGAAASAAIVSKLEPIYARVGFDKSTLTVNSDSTFVLKAGRITLKGNITAAPESKDSQANFIFNFSVAGKVKVGKAETYVTKSATGNLSVMFDVTKLIAIMETVGKVSGNYSVNTAVSLLKSYDGLCAGFEMKPAGTTK